MYLWPFSLPFWPRHDENCSSSLILRWQPQVENDSCSNSPGQLTCGMLHMREINFHLAQDTVFWGLSYDSSLTYPLFNIIHTRSWLLLSPNVEVHFCAMSLHLLLVFESVVSICWNPASWGHVPLCDSLSSCFWSCTHSQASSVLLNKLGKKWVLCGRLCCG